MGVALLIVLAVVLSPAFLLLLLAFAILILCDATIRNRSLLVGLLAVVASYVQLLGYGIGFIHGVFRRIVLGRDEFAAFQKTFYD